MKMARFSTFILGILILVFLSGCVSQHRQIVHFPDQQKSVEDPEKARIYVIRHPWLWNLASHMALVTICDEGLEIGTIAGHRGFLCWERKPGQAMISCLGDNGITVTFEKGKVYYFLQHLEPVWQPHAITFPGTGEMASMLELVDEAKGRKELSRCAPPTNVN